MQVSGLIGKVFVSAKELGDCIEFEDVDGIEYSLCHDQDCCESVYVEDVVGNMQDLVGAPLSMAEEVYSTDDPKDKEYPDESFTWTFYKFATIKGYVTIRFYGSSNGYYGETAQLHVNGLAQYD